MDLLEDQSTPLWIINGSFIQAQPTWQNLGEQNCQRFVNQERLTLLGNFVVISEERTTPLKYLHSPCGV
jgi:hypothetical protein